MEMHFDPVTQIFREGSCSYGCRYFGSDPEQQANLLRV
jgi:hypothetical protein